MDQVIHQLRRLTLLPLAAGQSDRELLERFRRRGDGLAFEALVRRHGPMVYGVCRRVLGNHHDAEDAFQATFLVLVRKSASVAADKSLANWLFGVANRTVRQAKARAATRQTYERRAAARTARTAAAAEATNELPAALDEALSQLADKYRIPFILCELEGISQRDAARQLGWPEGTLFVRLMRAKKLLAKRLGGRGFGPASVALSLLASSQAAPANVPAGLMISTATAACQIAAGHAAAAEMISVKVTALVEGVLRTMFFSNVKSLTVMILMALAGAGAALSFNGLRAGQEGTPPGTINAPTAQEPGTKKAVAPLQEPLEPPNMVLRNAVDERIKALRACVDARIKELESGRTLDDSFVTADRLLIAAEIEICATDRARQECVQRALSRVQPLKERFDREFKAGTIGPAKYHFLDAHYYDVVAKVEHAKAKEALTRVSSTDPVKARQAEKEALRKIREAERDAYRKSFDALMKEYEVGKVAFYFFLDIHRRLMFAEVKLCETAEEQFVCIQRHVDFFKPILQAEEKRFKDGITGPKEYHPFRGHSEELHGELLSAMGRALEEKRNRLSQSK